MLAINAPCSPSPPARQLSKVGGDEDFGPFLGEQGENGEQGGQGA